VKFADKSASEVFAHGQKLRKELKGVKFFCGAKKLSFRFTKVKFANRFASEVFAHGQKLRKNLKIIP
jgi:hypothetical protein